VSSLGCVLEFPVARVYHARIYYHEPHAHELL